MSTKTSSGNIKVMTIPKSLTGSDELVLLSRKTFEAMVSNSISETNLLKISKEAKKLKKMGALPILKSLKNIK